MPEASALPAERAILGANAYCWDLEQQNWLLVSCLAPLLAELERSATPCRLFFDRHDTRGPHLLLLLTVPASARAEAGRLFEERLESFLERLEPPQTSAEEALLCHRAIGGRVFAEPDAGEGLAERGSCVFFEQPEKGWPFAFAAGLSPAGREAVWDGADRLARGVIGRLAASGGNIHSAQAGLLVAAFDAALGLPDAERAAFWRFYCGTFLHTLEDEIARDPDLLPRIEAGIGKNRQAFDRIWGATAKAAAWPEVADWARALGDSYRESGRWRLPRELLHTTLKQLMLNPRTELPLAFYAWRRSWTTAA
jgi:hypothetical protein